MTDEIAKQSLYSEAIQQRAELYLIMYDKPIDFGGTDSVIPTVSGLAMYLGVHKDTCYEWAKHHEEFQTVLKNVKTMQEHGLMNGGVSGKYNAMMSKFLLSSNHGHSEKVITDNRSGDGSMSPVPTVIEVTAPDESN